MVYLFILGFVVSNSDADLEELRQSKGRHAKFICDITKFYRDWHVKSDGVHGDD